MGSVGILYLGINLFRKGGIQRYSRAQIRALRELVREENVVVFSLSPPDQDQFEEPFETAYTGSGGSTLGRVRFILRALQAVLSLKPRVIWVNHVKLLTLANVLGRLWGKRLIVGNVYGLEVWTDLHNYEVAALRSADHIVSDCFSTASYIENALKVNKEKISVVWDPVDIEKFIPRNTAEDILPCYGVPYSPDNCYLMTLGRISEKSRHKGYDRVLDVMKMMARGDVIYLIVGDGDDRFRLENRVKEEGLAGNVFFLGSIPEGDLVGVYNSTDIFVLVSDRGYGRGEGVPLTPLEAAACGKPIIVGNEDGSSEAVHHGENGYIVSPRNLDSIYQAIIRLVNDPNLREGMGRLARKRVVQDFSYEAFKNRTADILEKLR